MSLKATLDEWSDRWIKQQPALWMSLAITYSMAHLLLLEQVSENGGTLSDTFLFILEVFAWFMIGKAAGAFVFVQMLIERGWRRVRA